MLFFFSLRLIANYKIYFLWYVLVTPEYLKMVIEYTIVSIILSLQQKISGLDLHGLRYDKILPSNHPTLQVALSRLKAIDSVQAEKYL